MKKIKFNNKEFVIANDLNDITEAIDLSGELLLKRGCISQEYILGMHNRNKIATVAVGNGLAIPHGRNEDKKYILKTGLSLILFPKGLKWDQKMVYVAIGIAAKNDEHMDFIQVIATIFSKEGIAQKLAQLKNIKVINKFIKVKYKELL